MRPKEAEPEYVHGYTATEQQRLVDQAQFLSRYLFRDIDFHEQHHILEMGCGVGAQSKILLEKFPRLKISGVDISKTQLEKAAFHLQNEIASERISLHHTDGKKVPFARETFDGAYLCWILEHTIDPNAVLEETRRTLKSGAVIYATEVYNATLFLYPECPHTMSYWKKLNDLQMSFGGDPNVGIKLGNMMRQAGFQGISTKPLFFLLDSTVPEQKSEWLTYFYTLLQSALPGLLQQQQCNAEELALVKTEIEILREREDAIFALTAIQAKGFVPE